MAPASGEEATLHEVIPKVGTAPEIATDATLYLFTTTAINSGGRTDDGWAAADGDTAQLNSGSTFVGLHSSELATSMGS